MPGAPGRLLEVGAARGAFLKVMAERGWQVAGIEAAADPDALDQVPITHARFPDESPFEDAAFDVITAWAVFEHLHDPARAFSECRRMLKPGGRLIIQVPNAAAPFRRGLLFQDVPRHLYFFTESTLHRFAARAGLHVSRIDHTPEFYGGSERQVLRLGLIRALGRSRDDFEEMYRTPRRERFRRWPLLTPAWLAAAGFERVIFSDWIVRHARISATITAHFERPAHELPSSGQSTTTNGAERVAAQSR
ncbi:MAG: class I SAM-dependent methyltransferase [Gaiellaceae bacterium]